MSDIYGRLTGLGIRFQNDPLFGGLNYSFSDTLTGLVAPNGRGKSVLLQLLAGNIQPSAGSVHWQVPVASLGQVERLQGPRLADALGVGMHWSCFQRIEQGVAEPEDLDRVAELWHLPGEWQQLLASAGVHKSLNDSVAGLSGGEQTRLALCRLFLKTDHYLLLDEPTNHLDGTGRQWLMSRLEQHRGGALVASHDRALLRKMNRIIELTPNGLVEYGGGYDLYRSVKTAQIEALEEKVDHLAAERRKQKQVQQATLEKAASRRKQGERERRSGSQGKMLMDGKKNRAEGSLSKLKQQHQQRTEQVSEALLASKAQLEQKRAQRLTFATEGLRGGVRLHLSELVLPHGDDQPLSITVQSGERWHIAGNNGSGKSTLLKVIAGREAPRRGACEVHGSVLYLDQHFSLLQPTESAFSNLKRLHPERRETDLRTQLAGMRLRGDKALLPISQLSGGERLKVALLAVTGGHRAPDLLLLDEPDNHLDLDSRELLEASLIDYPGTLLVVSHDADFISALAPDHRLTLICKAESHP